MKLLSSHSENKRAHTQHMQATLSAKRYRIRPTLIIVGGRLVLLGCLLGVWQFASGRLVNPLFISNPQAVLRQFVVWISDGTLWYHTALTLEETLLGLFFGLIIGILAGFLFGLEPVLGKIIDPFIAVLYSIPKLALAPLFILWFGIELPMQVIFVAITVFFLVFLSTLAGVRNVDQDLINAVRLMGGKRRVSCSKSSSLQLPLVS